MNEVKKDNPGNGMGQRYQVEIDQQTAVRNRCKKRSDSVGTIRLGLFAVFIINLYITLSGRGNWFYRITLAGLLLLQIAAWIWHNRLGESVSKAAAFIDINERYLKRLQGSWHEFSDTGAEFCDPGHAYGSDLDIVGEKSLFQFCSVAHTWHGRKAFAGDLLEADYHKDEIKQRQEAVKELAGKISWMNEAEYHCGKIGGDASAGELEAELQNSESFITNRALQFGLRWGPVLTVLLGGAAIILKVRVLYLPAAALLLLQGVLWLGGFMKTSRYLHALAYLPYRLRAYAELLDFIRETEFTSELLQRIRHDLTGASDSAAAGMKALSKIADKLSIRSNAIGYFLINLLLLWDYECAFLYQEWKEQYSSHCSMWFKRLAELESLTCFAALYNVCGQCSFPVIQEQRGITAEELGHPLISEADRVTNPLLLDEDILIISGSNMSGKTTYLRTVGINIVLARAGGPVCAGAMRLSDLHVVTSMRIADDLNEGISTFYAELKRIKQILDAAQHDPETLFLIDEIFRGTNSADRMSGAKTVITRLSQWGITGMITTHDLELCTLEKTYPRIKNYSFAEDYRDNQIIFDYRLRKGRSQTTNARYLMEMVGIY